MKRREFITLLGGAAGWPIATRAQQPGRPVVGVLGPPSPGPYAPYVTAFARGLTEAGYVEGQYVAIEYLWAENQNHPMTISSEGSSEAAGILSPGLRCGGYVANGGALAPPALPVIGFMSARSPEDSSHLLA